MTTITLNSPVSYKQGDKDITVSEVTLRKAKVKDLKASEEARREAGSDFNASVALVASIVGLPVSVVEDFDADDFTAVQEALAPFLPKGPSQTGGE